MQHSNDHINNENISASSVFVLKFTMTANTIGENDDDDIDNDDDDDDSVPFD